MSLARYAKRRDSNEADIVDALRKAGVKVWHLDRPCDLLTYWRALWVPLEVKPPKDARWQAGQEAFCRTNRVPVVTTPEEALRAVGVR